MRLRSQRQAGRVRPHRDLQGLGRGTTECEEVVVDADPFQTQYLTPDLGQDLLGAACAERRRPAACRTLAPGGRHQGPAVHLSARRERQRVRSSKTAGTIAAGKQLQQEAAQLSRGRRGPPAATTWATSRVLPRPSVPAHHGVLGHRGVFRQRGLHLTRLDPEAVDLHLDSRGVPGTRCCRRAGTWPGHRCGRASGRGPAIAAERIGDKTGGRRVGPVEVAASDPDTADQQLAGHPDGHRLLMGVHNVRANVGDRSPDRDQPCRIRRAVQWKWVTSIAASAGPYRL